MVLGGLRNNFMSYVFTDLSRLVAWFLRRRRHRVGSVMYCGDTGSFKTYSAVADCLASRSVIFSNIPIRGLFGQRVITYDDFEGLCARTCGSVLIDEAGEVLDAQKWAKLPEIARKAALEQRKSDWRLILTTQSPDFVDKTFRVLCHEVVFCRRWSLPLLGLFFPDSHVKDLKCAHCGEVMIRGDWFSFGTIVCHESISWDDWDKYRKALMESSINLALQNKAPRPLVRARRKLLYSQKIADCYSSAVGVKFHRDSAIRPD